MRPAAATFWYRTKTHGLVQVRFTFTSAGEACKVFVVPEQGSAFEIDNADYALKPCATHAAEAVRRAYPAPPRSPHEAHRRLDAKRARNRDFRLVGDE